MGAVILAILKSNWKPILIGLVILGLAGYIETLRVERDHYKADYGKVELQLNTLVNNSKKREDELNSENQAITAKYKDTLLAANTLVTANAKLNEENIKNAKELANVKLSLNAIRLFNASKQSAPGEDQPAKPVQGNDAKTGTTQAASNAVTLQDMLLVVNYNDANHKLCIKQVEEWQAFWNDYQAAVEASNSNNAVSH